METEVYLICKTCNEITDGKGSGDFRDIITCGKCNSHFTSINIGYFRPLEDDKKEKRLYAEEGFLDL